MKQQNGKAAHVYHACLQQTNSLSCDSQIIFISERSKCLIKHVFSDGLKQKMTSLAFKAEINIKKQASTFFYEFSLSIRYVMCLTASDWPRRSSNSCWYFIAGVLPFDWMSFFRAWATSSLRLRAVALIPTHEQPITKQKWYFLSLHILMQNTML